jgi:hypothetical protein
MTGEGTETQYDSDDAKLDEVRAHYAQQQLLLQRSCFLQCVLPALNASLCGDQSTTTSPMMQR